MMIEPTRAGYRREPGWARIRALRSLAVLLVAACVAPSAPDRSLHFEAEQARARGDGGLALRMYRQSCREFRVGESCTEVGRIARAEAATERDRARALEWTERGCDQGDGRGCYDLGELFRAGELDAKAQRRAEELLDRYRLSCIDGFAAGCYGLSAFEEYGLGLPRNRYSAEQHRKKACRLGHAPACETSQVASPPE